MNAKVTWSQRMTFSGSADSGFSVPLGASPDVGGDDDGFRPMELLLVGLAGCTAMDVISLLQKKRQVVDAFEVQVQAERAEEHPRVFTRIRMEYVLTGKNIEREAVERSVQLSADKYCPAQAMFKQILPLELVITINETGG
jgi:putative redox protein